MVISVGGDSGGSLMLGVVVVLVLGGLVLTWWYQRKRIAALQAWASRIGWTYVGADSSLLGRWRGQPFGIGHSRRVSELVTGPFGPFPASSFRYRYTTGSGKNQTTHSYHVMTMSLPTFLPTLELTPEGIGARIAKVFGAEDLQFESEEFNKLWRVEARDLKFASDVLHPRALERLCRPDAAGMSLRIEGTDVLCWEIGSPDVDRIAARLGVLRALVDSIPRFVWLDHGYDPPGA
jgi:hypothetical protein